MAGKTQRKPVIEVGEAPRNSRPTVGRPCPECSRPLNPVAVVIPGSLRVCPYCAAVMMLDATIGPRKLLTQEWHDLCCRPGHNHVWDERERVMEKLTSPPRGLMVKSVDP